MKREACIAETRAWVERAVVGLNLCPFAKMPLARDLIRYVVSDAISPDALLAVLAAELEYLASVPEAEVETTLLIHPCVLGDFAAFNAFLGRAEDLVANVGLEGVMQVASFHPQYRFAGTGAGDIGNATNRSPFPTLHLLRESSMDRAVAAFPDPETIFAANIATLQALGSSGWAALQDACRRDASGDEEPRHPR